MNNNNLTPDMKVQLYEIAHKMNTSKLPRRFIADAVETAVDYEGIYHLMHMWQQEGDAVERDEIVADIQDLVDDCQVKDQKEVIPVSLDRLSDLAQDTRRFKDQLRLIINAKGGIKRLSELSGIPKSALIRFFRAVTVPRKVTLHKIAKAFNLSEAEINIDWGI